MSVVQPPRKRKFFLKGEGDAAAESMVVNGCCESERQSPSPGGSNGGAPLGTVSVPGVSDEAFATFIQHAIDLAASKQAHENSLVTEFKRERENLRRQLAAAEEKLNTFQQQPPPIKQQPPDTPPPALNHVAETVPVSKQLSNGSSTNSETSHLTSSSPSSLSSPTSVNNLSSATNGTSSKNNSNDAAKLKQQQALEQRNRELQRSLDLSQRDLAHFSNLLRTQTAEGAKKDALLVEREKELERLRTDLAQARQRLETFMKSAADQAILAKSLQEELNSERELRVHVEGKLRTANECVMLGMQFEERLKAIAKEKIELEAELNRLKAENLRLVATYGDGGTVKLEPSSITNNGDSSLVTTGSEKLPPSSSPPLSSSSPSSSPRQHQITSSCQSIQTDNDAISTSSKSQAIKNEDDILKLQFEIDSLQRQLAMAMSSADSKSFFDHQSIDILNHSNNVGDSSEVPSSPTQLQSENSLLKRRVAELEQELEKRKVTMEWHHKTWMQKCEAFRLLEEKVRDRDIQCAKYHYELEVVEKKLRMPTDKFSLSSTSSSPSILNISQSQAERISDGHYGSPCEF